MLYSTLLYYTTLYYTIPHYTIPYDKMLYSTIRIHDIMSTFDPGPYLPEAWSTSSYLRGCLETARS